jgi:DNA-binding transcriptional MerR regulator
MIVGREPRIQPPALEAFSDMPLFNTKAVVRTTGVPAPTLRAWERRYGILSPRRGENDYRLYSERDIAMVTWLRERVESGMTISQAIALLRSLEPGRKRRSRARATSAPVAELPVQVTPARAAAVLSLDDLWVALLRQFVSLDEVAATRTIAQAHAIYSIEDVCLYLYTPVLVEIGRLWAEGEVSVAVEHFASSIIRAQMESLFRSSASLQAGSLVLVGCAPDELHELGALMVALFLRRAGLRVAYLGQSVETDGLMATIASARPAGVVLSVTLPAHASALEDIGARLRREFSPAPHFFFGGQAFSAEPEVIPTIPGEYLAGAATEAVGAIRGRLGIA